MEQDNDMGVQEHKEDYLTELMYNYEKDGTFSAKVGNYYVEAGEMLLNDVIRAAKQNIIDSKERVMKGEVSPLVYYMAKNMMDVYTLSKFVKLPGWRIKRHIRPEIFARLKSATLQRYADAFEISVEELMKIK
jgi:hypothetical protein